METKQVYPVVLQLVGLSSQQNKKLIKNDNIQWDGLLTVTIEQLTMKVTVVISPTNSNSSILKPLLWDTSAQGTPPSKRSYDLFICYLC